MNWAFHRERLDRMVAAGATLTQIAAEFGVTRSAAAGAVARFKFESVRRQGQRPEGMVVRRRKPAVPVNVEPAVPVNVEPAVPVSVKPAVPVSVKPPRGHRDGTILDLTGCRFIAGDPREEAFPWCDDPVARGAWCARHHALVYDGERAA